MAKFCGKLGFAITKETEPGVWTESITEKRYYGDVTNYYKSNQNGEGLNDDIATSATISIIADPFARNNYSSIKYVNFMNTSWKISKIDIQYPRIIISLGGLYNG